jgi:hypothetical protein
METSKRPASKGVGLLRFILQSIGNVFTILPNICIFAPIIQDKPILIE